MNLIEELAKLRELFLKYLTVDSESMDMRRRDFNQAIFMPFSNDYSNGKQVFNGTDLEMVMEKFDKAVKELEKMK